MNNSTAIFLVNEKVRAIYVTYEPCTEKTSAPRTMFKTLDSALKPKDLVIVPKSGGHGFTVAKVESVDAKVDFDDATDVKWIAGKVDLHAYEVCLSREGDMLKIVREADENHRREELRAKIFANSADKVKGLSIAQMSDLNSLPPHVVENGEVAPPSGAATE